MFRCFETRYYVWRIRVVVTFKMNFQKRTLLLVALLVGATSYVIFTEIALFFHWNEYLIVNRVAKERTLTLTGSEHDIANNHVDDLQERVDNVTDGEEFVNSTDSTEVVLDTDRGANVDNGSNGTPREQNG